MQAGGGRGGQCGELVMERCFGVAGFSHPLLCHCLPWGTLGGTGGSALTPGPTWPLHPASDGCRQPQGHGQHHLGLETGKWELWSPLLNFASLHWVMAPSCSAQGQHSPCALPGLSWGAGVSWHRSGGREGRALCDGVPGWSLSPRGIYLGGTSPWDSAGTPGHGCGPHTFTACGSDGPWVTSSRAALLRA